MKDLISSLILLFVMTVGLGLIYPFAVWAVAQTAFHHQANGSLIERDGKTIGSTLIGQRFEDSGYFQGRLSANSYDGANSGGSNLGPTSAKLLERIETDATVRESWNPAVKIPADLVTTSASGLDPHISVPSAHFQIGRVAAARRIDETALRSLVESMTEGRDLGIFGVPRVNVVMLNLELDSRFPRK